MKNISLYLMAAIYFFAGLNHLRAPEMYLKMMPPYLPAPYLLVIASGLIESALGLLLLWTPARPWAAWGIMALLIAVFPANLYMFQMRDSLFQQIPIWILALRLPAQILLIRWAYSFTSIVTGGSAAPN